MLCISIRLLIILNQHTQAALLNQLAVSVELPSGYLAVRYGIDGPF